MTVHAIDTETHPFKPGDMAPRMVCLQDREGIYTGPAMRNHWVELLTNADLILVGHYIAYDMACAGAMYPDLLPLIFDAYEADRVTCTRVREKLIRIAEGRDKHVRSYSLIASCARHGIAHGYRVDAKGNKAEDWQTNYADLEDVPIADWPPAALRYAMLDGTNARKLYDAQERAADPKIFLDQYRQARADFFLHLTQVWGIHTDPAAVARLLERIEEEYNAIKRGLQAAGLVRPVGTKDIKAAKARMERVRKSAGLKIPLTKKGATSLDAEACQTAHDPESIADYCDDAPESLSVLEAYARFGSVTTLRSRAQRLAQGVRTPLHTSYDVLKETGRTSCRQGEYGIQVQNMNREPGLRECVIPRKGCVIISVDWTGAELHTFAQVCIDLGIKSKLAERLNAGINAHDSLAARMLRVPYERFMAMKAGDLGLGQKAKAKTNRQAAKPANFGYPGGMGPDAFRSFAAGNYGVILSEHQSRQLKVHWQEETPESVPYFEKINAIVENGQGFPHLRSHRWRGGATYCATANSLFQGSAADMAKDAGFRLARRCYVGGLLARPIAFIHDEFLVEAPEHVAAEVAESVVDIMEDAGRRWCPDCPPKAEPAIMRRWTKAAEPVWSAEGVLQVWEK